jgi:hypothetical protein
MGLFREFESPLRVDQRYRECVICNNLFTRSNIKESWVAFQKRIYCSYTCSGIGKARTRKQKLGN